MAFGSDSKISIELEVDSTGAIAGFKQVNQSVDKLEENARRSGSALDSFFSGIKAGFGIEAARVAIDALVSGLRGIPAAVRQGAEIDDIAASFEKLSTQAGASGDALISKFSTALGNTIPKVDLMRQANELLVGGLDPEQFELVAKAARSLGETTGTDAAQGLDKLSDSLLRGNDRALKNLGIVVDNTKAYADYAAKIGTTADLLSEEGKVLATREAVLKALAENQQKLGDVSDDAADKLDQLTTALENQKNEALRTLANNKELNQVLDQLNNIVKEIDFTPLIASLTSLLNLISSVGIPAFKGFAEAAASAFSVLDPSGAFNILTSQLGAVSSAMKDQAGAVKDLKTITSNLALAKTKEDVDKVQQSFAAWVQQTQKLNIDTKAFGAQITEYSKKLDSTRAALDKNTEGTAKGTKGQKDFTSSIDKTKAALKDLEKKEKEETEAKKKQDEALKQYLGTIKETFEKSASYETVLEDLREGSLDEAEAVEKLRDALEEAKNQTDAAGRAGSQFDEMLQMVASGLGVTNEQLRSYIDNLRETAAAQDDVENSRSGLEEALKGNLGSTVTSIGKTLIDSLFNGKTLKNGDWANLAGDAANSVVQELLGDIPIIGDLVAELADQAVQAIVRFFGHEETAGTKARKTVQGWFHDLFDENELGIIVNNQLVKLEDIIYKGTTLFGGNVSFDDNSWSAFLQSLPGEAQAAFNGVGAGLEELLGVSDDISGQIGAIIANNIGGSLNNLQLLVQATGYSFEQLRGAVIKAFEEGKISAAEAMSQLQGIAQISQKGIPDGLGLVKQAFDNMKAAGVKGGAALIDAIQDIGHEAKELHINTLPALADYLVKVAGEDAGAVSKLMAALSAAGIDSIEELTGATTEQLLPVLAQLENSEFPFSKASADAKDLVDQVNEIPDHKNVVVNIKANLSNEDRRVINSTANLQGVSDSGWGISSQ